MILETEKNLIDEKLFAADLSRRFGCRFAKTAQFAKIDYCLLRGKKIVAFGELKHRNFSFLKYDSVLVDLVKWLFLIQLSEVTKLPVFLFVRYVDADIFLKVKNNIKSNFIYREDDNLCAKMLIDNSEFHIL